MKETANNFIKRNSQKYCKGTIIKPEDIGRKGKLVFEFVEDRIYCQQTNLPEKVFFLDKLKKLDYEGKISFPHGWHKGEIEYRLGYYIISQFGKRKGNWIFGQFNPIIPLNDLKKLLQEAKNKGAINSKFKIV